MHQALHESLIAVFFALADAGGDAFFHRAANNLRRYIDDPELWMRPATADILSDILAGIECGEEDLVA